MIAMIIMIIMMFKIMMTSSNGNIFRVTGHLCGEFTGPRWIPRTKASDAELSLICVWINGWVNNREAGDLRCYRAHYDVTVMYPDFFLKSAWSGIPLTVPWLLFKQELKVIHMTHFHPEKKNKELCAL